MAIRTVRLEPETERALQQIVRATGLSASAAIRRGVLVLHERIKETASASPLEIYSGLDLGPGGYARAPARRAKQCCRRSCEGSVAALSGLQPYLTWMELLPLLAS
jgi:hypothetical protein